MDIKTKFNVDDEVFFLKDNKVQSCSVKRIAISVQNGVYNQLSLWIRYYLYSEDANTYHNEKDNNLHSSKEELLKNL